jgi:hypothetical protein
MRIKKTPQQLRHMGIAFIVVGVLSTGLGMSVSPMRGVGFGVVCLALGAALLARGCKAPGV